MRSVVSLLSAAVGLCVVAGWVTACDDSATPGGVGDAAVDGGGDAKVDTRPAETPPCHVDCLGNGSCVAGKAIIPNRGAKPCDSSGFDCGIAAQYDCSRGCAKAPPKNVIDSAEIGLLCEGGLGDGHTGARCTKDADCGLDPSYRCEIAAAGAPTCVLHGDIGFRPCDPQGGASRCDGDRGVCIRVDAETSACLTGCALDASGAFVLSCPSARACELRAMGKDRDGSTVTFGTCGGGCHVDADCAVGVCDPAVHYCTDVKCDGTAPCAPWGSAPRTCVADTSGSGKHCRIAFPKKDGEACTPAPTILGAECSCLGAGSAGVCASECSTGALDCDVGFTCDPLFPAPAGVLAWPAGITGRCLRACTSDGDCLPGLVCDQTAGVPTRTCRPK